MNDSKQHIENTWLKIRPIFEKAAAVIDALKPGEKVAATELAASLAKEYDMKGPQLYTTLKFLFDGYPGVVVRKGAHGGIIKLGADETPAPETVSTEETESK